MDTPTDWLELQFCTDPECSEWAEELLCSHGAQAVTLAAAGTDEVLEPGVNSHPLWQLVAVRGLFGSELDPLALLAALAPHLPERENRSLSIRRLAGQPWERVWLQHYQPLSFGQDGNLSVVPVATKSKPGRAVVRLDPGLAFGTGTHATTALCLDALANQPPLRQRVLDYGCGSGILAIAACVLGATEVTAVDNDPQALQATAANALRNEATISTVDADQFTGGQYDLVIANILANTLIELAPAITGWVRPGGRLILAGVLDHQADRVLQAYSPAFAHWQLVCRDDWVALTATATDPAHVHSVS